MELPDYVWRVLEGARDDGNENVRDLHPTLAWRAYLLIEDCWAKWGLRSVTIESAVRTEAEQRYLYKEWLAGRFSAPVVANPDRRLASTPIGPMRGSWHMQQKADGYGHAIDFTRPGQRMHWGQVHAVADQYGLWHGVGSEPWHMQALTSYAWIQGPVYVPEIPEPEEEDMPFIRHDTTTNQTWQCEGNRARVMADGDDNPTGVEYARKHDLKIIADANERYVIEGGLYDLVG